MNYDEKISYVLEAIQKGEIQEAVLNLESMINSNPDKFQAYYILGRLCAKHINNLPAAIEFMKKAVDITPFYEGFMELVNYSLRENNLIDSLKYIKSALIYNPECETCKKYLKNLFPKEANFIKDSLTKIKGTYEHSKDCPTIKYKKSYDKGCIERKSPKFLDEILTDKERLMLDDALSKNKINDYSEGFVIQVTDGRAFVKQSEQTYIITQDDKILNDMLVESCKIYPYDEMPPEVHVSDKMLVLSSCWGGNFYHWLTWTIPRISMIENAGYSLQDFDKIVINYLGFKFQRELAMFLDIPMSKIIATSSHGTVLKAKTLVTASLPHHLHTPKIVTDSLREKFLKPEYIDKSMPERLYISRNKSTSRFILNEDEVFSYLKKFGFSIVYPEDYNILEQVKIFANADVIVSQHGAALVNLSYCKPGTKIIEIYNAYMKNIVDTGFFRICANVNLDHYFMFGDSVVEGSNANMTIDIDKLCKTMELAGMEEKKRMISL